MLEYTGERYLPWIDNAQAGYEHLHRYAFTLPLARGKRVLDLGCGEGYGTALLSEVAESVVGVDVDSEVIGHASSRYPRTNLTFLEGSIFDVPIEEDETFDLVVCFETIEHVQEQSQAIEEAKRLLHKDGLFVISTPNKLTFSDEQDREWQWHTKELHFNEFHKLISQYFDDVFFLGQRVFSGSSIWPLEGRAGGPKAAREYVIEHEGKEFIPTDPKRKVPLFFLAVATNSDFSTTYKELKRWHYLIDISSQLLIEKDTAIQEFKSDVEKLDTMVREKDGYLESKIQELERVYKSQETLLEEKDKSHKTIESLSEKVQEQDHQLNEADEKLQEQDNQLKKANEKVQGYEAQISNMQEKIKEQEDKILERKTEINHYIDQIDLLLNTMLIREDQFVDLENDLQWHSGEVRRLRDSLEELKDRNTAIERERGELKDKLQSAQHFIDLKHQDVLKAAAYIDEVHRSLGWRLIIRYRSILDRLAPEGSRRRRGYSLMMAGVKTIRAEGWRVFFKKAFRCLRRRQNVETNEKDQVEQIVDPHERDTNAHKGTAAICTVTSKNYLGFLRVFTRSALKYNPSVKVYVCLVDKIDDTFDPEQEPFELILMEDLDNIPNPRHFFFKYTALELNTAVKPYFFEYLFRHYGMQKLAFFDPDIQFFDSLNGIWELLENHSLVLTPHLTAPYEDDRWPTELEINQAGIFNLGFIGMSNTQSTLAFLKWWQQKLYTLCIMDHEAGMHVDQKWVNFAPAMFTGVYILRDPAYNIAYWNLHSRWQQLRYKPGKLIINGRPVVFFHFSGFDLNDIEQVSKHQNRFTLRDLPNLRPLFEDYRELIHNSGQQEAKDWPYAYARFDNGVRIPELARKLYRDLGDQAFRFGDPYMTEGPHSFFDWLNQPEEGQNVDQKEWITRLHMEIYRSRRDLPAAFPDVLGMDRTHYWNWLRASTTILGDPLDEAFLPEVLELPGPPPLVPPDKREKASLHQRLLFPLRERLKEPLKRAFIRSPKLLKRVRKWDQQVFFSTQVPEREWTSRTTWEKPLPFGVNVAGYISGEFGVAEVARGSIRALRAAGLRHVLNRVESSIHRHNDPSFKEVSATNPYRINLVHVNADQTSVFFEQKGWQYFQGRHTIGTWFWELSRFPEKWFSSFHYYQEIWVASHFCQESIAKESPIPVLKMTFPILVEDDDAQFDRARFSLPEDRYIFLFHFDYHSVFERKNPLAIFKAFRLAFGDQEDTMLVVKSINSEYAPDKLALIKEAAKGMNVRLIDEHVSRADMLRLMASCDCFVSLHRSEGLGLGMARSMYLGKPVIGTGYSGNMTFMNHNNSFLVRYRLVELDQDYGPYEKGNVWADPDVDHAAELMQLVYQDRSIAKQRGERASKDIKTLMSPEVAGEEMASRLRMIAGAWP